MNHVRLAPEKEIELIAKAGSTVKEALEEAISLLELMDVMYFDEKGSSGVTSIKYKLTCLVCGKEKYVFKDFFFTPDRGNTREETINQARSYIG